VRRYAWVTLAPLLFIATTTITAGVESIRRIYLPQAAVPATRITGMVNASVTVGLLVLVSVILLGSARTWVRILRAQPKVEAA
jgi:carbon starvation protein CstA